MYDYRDTTLEEYRGKLKDYQKILGTIPTDESETLERIMLNPANEREISLCALCLRFFDTTTKALKNITEEMRQNDECEYAVDFFEESLSEFLRQRRYSFETKKKYHKTILEIRPELVDKLSLWTKEELERVLSEPTTDQEYRLCQEYLKYLADEVDFKEIRDRYLDRLAYRGEVLSKLKNDEYAKVALEILLDPKTENELDFCTAYFGLQDDIKHLKENINQGNIQVPAVEEESTILNKVARVVGVLCRRETIQDELDFYDSASPSDIADMLYKLNCLESSDMFGLIKYISDKAGNSSDDTKLSSDPSKDLLKIYSAYTSLSTWMHNYPLYRIDRDNSDTKINRFMVMAEVFHGNYTNAAYSSDAAQASPVSPKDTEEKPKQYQKKTNNFEK